MKKKMIFMICVILICAFFSGCGPQPMVDANDAIIWDQVPQDNNAARI